MSTILTSFMIGSQYAICEGVSANLKHYPLVYNTVRIGQVLEKAKAQGQRFSAEAIAHISPLMRRHVIVNGTYDFSPTQGVLANNRLCV
jgi:hypothetical protein